jgi:flagellar hook protein FlgE
LSSKSTTLGGVPIQIAMRIESTALTGLWANQAKFDTAADNVANVNTPREQPVELADEFPAMTLADIGYTASARVLRAQDETSGDLIDVLG